MKQLTNPAQASWPVVVNENFDAVAAGYEQDYSTTTGLTLGYHLGHVSGTPTAAGAIALDASNTVYVVVHRTTGVVSKATSTTNWNATTTYGRLFKNTTSGSAITATEDWRYQPGGIFDNSSVSAVDADDVTYTPTTVADWDSSTDPGDVEQALDQLAGRVTDLEGAAASTTQTGEMMSGFISAPTAKDYKIVVKAAHGGTITETTTISASGTATFTFKINTTALGGTANSVSSSEQSQAHASSNAFSAGDDIVITASSISSPVDVSFTIKYTRVLA